MTEEVPCKPESPTAQVVEIRGRQRNMQQTAMIGVFFGVMVVGMCLALAFGWSGVAALPTIGVAFVAALVATGLVGEPYNRQVSRLWKEYHQASDRYYDQHRRPT